MTVTMAAGFVPRGACSGLDPELFHPERGASTSDAKATCSRCPVRIDCLEWAIATHQQHGIWGGCSERERRRIRRRLAAGQPVPELDPEWRPKAVLGRPPAPNPAAPSRASTDALPEPRKDPVMDLAIVPAATAEPRPTNGATPAPTSLCAQCGKPYVRKRKDQRFHSKECARAWYAAHPRTPRKTRKVGKPRAVAASPAPTLAPTPAPKPITPASPAEPTPAPAPTPADLPEQLIAHLLAASDRWAIEADLGDIRVSVTRGCR